MTLAEIKDDRITVITEMRDRDRMKTVPGSKWDVKDKQWSVPLSWASCISLRGVFGYELSIGPELEKWAYAARYWWIDPAMEARTAPDAPELEESEPNLYPFQRAGVKFLTTAGRALLADDMGSGKTIQLIRTINHLHKDSTKANPLPVLVVCPNSMKYTWKEEIEKWFPGAQVGVIDGTKAKRDKVIEERISMPNPQTGEDEDVPAYDFYVINWESLRLHTRVAKFGSLALTTVEKEEKNLNEIQFNTVIADEAHRAKEAKSKQTRALWYISQDAVYRFAATGTPIESNPAEYWALLHFISPNDFPRKTTFIDRYCQTSFNPWGGVDVIGLKRETEHEFRQIVDPRMIRRPKDLILPQLPEKIETVRLIPFGGKQATAYRQMEKTMLAELKDGEVVAALDPLQKFIRLSQFASAYAEIGEDGNVLLSEPSNKVDEFMLLLDEAGDEPIVAFAESKQLIHLVAERLVKANIPHGLITGDQDPQRRKLVVDAFQNGDLRVVMCTSAGAEGITLTRARILVFLQRFWSSIKNKQAADRVHRIGQERGVEIITFATRETVDEWREAALERKDVALQEILRDEEVRREMLSWSKTKR